MVDCTLPDRWPEEMVALLPHQQEMIDQFFLEGKLLNYAIAVEKAKLWAVFRADSEFEVREMMAELPLYPFFQVDISLLTAYEAPEEPAPVFSLN